MDRTIVFLASVLTYLFVFACLLVVVLAMSENPSERPSATDLLNCSCMQSVDFSVPCDELLVGEMLLPPPAKLSRSDSFCPGVVSKSGGGDPFGSRDLEDQEIKCSTPCLGGGGAGAGAAYRNFVSPPPLFRDSLHSHASLSHTRHMDSQQQQQHSSPRAGSQTQTHQPPRTLFKASRPSAGGPHSSGGGCVFSVSDDSRTEGGSPRGFTPKSSSRTSSTTPGTFQHSFAGTPGLGSPATPIVEASSSPSAPARPRI
jgi:hypothetical protein